MVEIINNLKEEQEVILTKVEYLANDYRNYPEQAELDYEDKIDIKEINTNGILLSVERMVKSPNNVIFSIFVSFDIKLWFKSRYEEDSFITNDELLAIAKENKDLFFGTCMAKISLIISEISAQIGRGIPIITPPQIINE
ncbi:MAG: hypothetical protein E7536_09465 [Ruminococcaceae bacterium]|nr:hypothetical protein [Oscillospiraceae bacterium]